MNIPPLLSVLVIGATGSIGRYVVEEALRQGYKVRALVRNAARAGRLPPEVEIVVGDVTRPETLGPAVKDVDAIVLTVNADGQGKAAAEAIYYGGVRNVLAAVGSRTVWIVLMTTIGVTERLGHYNRTMKAMTGNAAPNDSYAPADCPIRSCAPDGSTVMHQTSSAS